MRKFFSVLLAAVLLVSLVSSASADRLPAEKPDNYIGAMRVVWCNEWISLREEPKKTSNRLAQIPLGEIVYACTDIGSSLFYKCEYKGITGYALKGYLVPAPEFEPPVSSAVSKKMTVEEITGSGIVVLDWHDFNMSVIASHDFIQESGRRWEVLRIGCFINEQPIWGHEEKVEASNRYDLLKVFIGGVEDDWQVLVYDGGYGLSMLDLLSGRERWSVRVSDYPMGNASAYAVDRSGIIYIAGAGAPEPTAISMDGRVIWKAALDDPDLKEPYSIEIAGSTIRINYRCGAENSFKLVTFSSTGDVISVQDQSITSGTDTAP